MQGAFRGGHHGFEAAAAEGLERAAGRQIDLERSKVQLLVPESSERAQKIGLDDLRPNQVERDADRIVAEFRREGLRRAGRSRADCDPVGRKPERSEATFPKQLETRRLDLIPVGFRLQRLEALEGGKDPVGQVQT
jgi:hypothetical protein